jgi:predicted RNA-binding protein YlqC (UPF0109 family)
MVSCLELFFLKGPMKEFIAYIIKNLVEDPAAVCVEIQEKPAAIFIEVRVADKDIAKVVGRQGRTINALRTIVMSVGARFGCKVRLELKENPQTQEEIIEEKIEEVASSDLDPIESLS